MDNDELVKWLESQKFYELCQTYRHAKDVTTYAGFPTAAEAFQSIKDAILAALTAPAAQADAEPVAKKPCPACGGPLVECQHCEGDGTEPHTDNDVTGPALCSQCGGLGGHRITAPPSGVREGMLRAELERLRDYLTKALVASCNCYKKSHAPSVHSEYCAYRRLNEFLAMLDNSLRAEAEKLPQTHALVPDYPDIVPCHDCYESGEPECSHYEGQDVKRKDYDALLDLLRRETAKNERIKELLREPSEEMCKAYGVYNGYAQNFKAMSAVALREGEE